MELLTEAFIDAARMLPLLFIIYLLVEYTEHKNNGFMHGLFAKSKKVGPLLGAAVGTIPQCGFSVIASDLFSKRAISTGTLIAIFVATSDEAIPIMLAHPDKIGDMLRLILIKFIIAVICGFAIDLVIRTKTADHCGCSHHHHVHGNCESCDGGILRSAIIHSVKIFVFIFAVNLILGYAAEAIAPFMDYITGHKVLQGFLTSLFGIIPNCAASVVLTKLYIAGEITLASLIGGLCTGAGVGLVVLFKQNKSIRQNLAILGIIYAIGVISSIVLTPFLG